MSKLIIATACLGLAACNATAGGHQPALGAAMEQDHHGPHILTVTSNAEFDKTLAKLQDAITSRGLKSFAIIDHAKGAASIGEALNPTTLLIFGNPKGGTPFMQADQRLGVELPLKILVAVDDVGAVTLTYRDFRHTISEYGVTSQDDRITSIEGILAAIAAEAAAP